MRTALIIVAVLVTASSSAASYLVVTSKNIKNGTIQPIDLSAKARRTLRGTRGPRGPEGPAGADGPRGPQGERGLFGVFSVYGPFAAVAPGSVASSTATCPSGIAVGGGFSAQNLATSLVAVESRAVNLDVGWTARMKNTGNYTETFNTQVVCAY